MTSSNPEEIKRETEKVKLVGLNMDNLLNKEFLKDLKEFDPDVVPAILLIGSKKAKGLITIGHENPEEYDKKIIHVGTIAETAGPVEKLIKIVEKLKSE